MAKAIDNIYAVLNNPFKLMGLIVDFYSNYESQDNDLLLSYLVLPLILNEYSRKKLKNLTKRCNLLTLTKDSDSVIGLELMIDEYKEITNRCIQIAISNGYLELKQNRSLSRTDKVLEDYFLENSDMWRATKNFAIVLKSNDIVSIYRMLGVKKI